MEELGNQKNNEEKVQTQETVENAETEEVKASEQTTDSNDENEEKSSFLSDVLEIFESVVISVLVVLLVFTYIARPVTVEGRSMCPTLDNDDKLIMRTLFYTPEFGDIVIVNNEVSHTFKSGTEELKEGSGLNKRLIKRVIATGGQTIDIDFNTGAVTVDGEVLEEDYIADITTYNAKGFEYPVTVPEGYVFVMGDNRNNSTDSRDSHVGFVHEDDVLGEAILRFYPFDKFELLD
ncbi:MAG: signal peptidase I [Oscillospiraceae bacterium]|nr:signal peptidase I [Oscillospiraceae bacterium]